jgi:hypothetical protein
MTANTQLTPVSVWAQILSNVELFGSLVIVVLLVFIVLTVIRERYNKDLEKVVAHAGSVSGELRTFLQENYDITLAGAENLLFRANPIAAKWLLQLRYGAARALELETQFDREKSGEGRGDDAESNKDDADSNNK